MCIVYMRIVYMCIAIDAKNRVLKYDIVGSGGGCGEGVECSATNTEVPGWIPSIG